MLFFIAHQTKNSMSTDPFLVKTCTVSNVLSGQLYRRSKYSDLKYSHLTVPQYQRFYAWGEKQVEDLLTDIEEAIKEKEKAFFLGPMLLSQNNKNEKTLEITDGQQRLVTVSIILAHIMHELMGTSKQDEQLKRKIKRIRNCLCKTNTDLSELGTADLRMDFSYIEENDQYKLMISQGQSMGNGKFGIAIKTIQNHFDAKQQEEILEYLNFLLDKVYFVAITTDNYDYINKIFETLNDRGEPLNQLELFKNLIISQIDPKDEDRDEKRGKQFDRIETYYTALGKDIGKMERYLQVYTWIHHGYEKIHSSSSKKDLYRFWKRQIQQKSKEKRARYAERVMSNLCSQIRFYRPSIEAKDKFWDDHLPDRKREKYHRAIAFISRYNVSQPLLFSLLLAYKKDPCSSEFLRCCEIVYALLARIWMVYGFPRSEKVEEILTKSAYTVIKEKEINPEKLLTHIKQNIRNTKYEDLMEDIKFREEISQISYPEKNSDRPEFILSEIVRTDQPNIDVGPAASIEHVLPRGVKHLPNWKEFDFQGHFNNKDRLGNMILLKFKDNKNIDGSSFEEKRPTYAKSEFNLTKRVAQQPSWGIHQINAQQRWYAGRITEIVAFPKIKS